MLGDIFPGTSPKIIHAKEVYNVIRSHGSITKLDLSKGLGIPLTTINRIVTSLTSIGLIEEEGIGRSSGGRKPVLYKIKSDMYYLVGVDISRTSVKIVLTDFTLNIVEKCSFSIRKDIEPNVLVSELVSCIKKIVNSVNISWDKILGVGVGTVGPLDKGNGVILEVEGFTNKGWVNFPLKHAMEKELGVLSLINSGANAATLAEYWGETGKHYKNLVYVNVGVGLRCGIVSNGLLVNPLNNNNEDIYGHIIVAIDGRQCYCGSRGCIERYVSVPAIVQSYKEALVRNNADEQEREIVGITWEGVCQSINSGEKIGLNAITEAAIYLSAGLINIINILNPNAVILGGLAITSCNLLYDFSVSLTKERLKNNNCRIHFGKGIFGEDEVAVGSATFILDYYLGRAISEVDVGTA